MLHSLTASRSLTSALARSRRPARIAASSRVRSTASRCAWLPPNSWTRVRTGSSSARTCSYCPAPNWTRLRHTGSPTAEVIAAPVVAAASARPAPPELATRSSTATTSPARSSSPLPMNAMTACMSLNG